MELRIKLKENEGFFGGAIDDGLAMPYGLKDFSRNLKEWHAGNQASSSLISNKGRYIYSNYPFNIEVKDREIILSNDYEIIIKENGNSLKEAYLGLVDDFFVKDNKTPNLLMFEKPQFNTWIEMEWDCSQEKVLNYAHEIIKNGYPAGVLMIDDCWCKDYGVWKFDTEKFPNPKEMISELHELGFTVMLWCCPFISPDSDVFRELEAKKLLVKNKNDETAISHWWNGYSAVFDLTIKEARDYLMNILKGLQKDLNIDGFKMDAGDPDYYHEGFKFSDGSEKSFQAHIWAEMAEEFDFNELRVAFNNGLRCVTHRLRDKNHSWDNYGLNQLIPNAIAMGLCGYPYLCPDMVGGGMVPDFHRPDFVFDEELFIRYAQVSALFPMIQLSRSPWKVLSSDNQMICYEACKLHNAYSSLVKELAINASKTGEPIIRHLAYEFNDDKYLNINDEFMLGSNILVAPQVYKGKTRKIVLPDLENDKVWIDEKGNEYKGGEYIMEVPLSRLPIFRRS